MNYLLILIGTTLFGLSIILLLGSSFTRKEINREEGVQTYKKKKGECILVPFRLPYNSKVWGNLRVREGELEFSLQDYFGWVPQSPIDWVLVPSHKLWIGHGDHCFEINLASGEYVFVLVSKVSPTRAYFNWRITYYIKPLKQLKDLGLVFIEVSVPLLVTGIVI
jgi:hypothetical protein